jgi:hypothetical protein
MIATVDPRFEEKMLLRIHANMIQQEGLNVDTNLQNYRSVGYMIDNRNSKQKKKTLTGGRFNPDLTLPITNCPSLKQRCMCEHPIAWNAPVRHVDNPRIVFMFGRCCIKRFFGSDGLKRSCRDCGAPHRNQTSMYCKLCRVKCKCCKTFHPDNGVCVKCDSCKSATRELITKDCKDCFKNRILNKRPSFNSKYCTVREVFKDKSYIQFLLTNEWFKRKPEYEWYHQLK